MGTASALPVTDATEPCSKCQSWQLPEGEDPKTCDVGTCTDPNSKHHNTPTMFADTCGTWKPITISKLKVS